MAKSKFIHSFIPKQLNACRIATTEASRELSPEMGNFDRFGLSWDPIPIQAPPSSLTRRMVVNIRAAGMPRLFGVRRGLGTKVLGRLRTSDLDTCYATVGPPGESPLEDPERLRYPTNICIDWKLHHFRWRCHPTESDAAMVQTSLHGCHHESIHNNTVINNTRLELARTITWTCSFTSPYFIRLTMRGRISLRGPM
jgi:hypothetical protein